MRKFIHKVKGSISGSKPQKPTDDRGRGWDQESSKYVVEPPDPVDSPKPTPAPGWDYHTRHQDHEAVSPVDHQDDVGTFSGFDSWLSSFTPDPHAGNIQEMPVQPVYTEHLIMKGYPPEDYINLSLNGVKKPSHAQKVAITIQGPWYMTYKQVVALLKQHNYEEPASAKHASLATTSWTLDKAVPREFQILAVDGPSCYNIEAESGLLINRDEAIGVFADNLRRLRIRCKEGKVEATSFPGKLEITFNRTLRLPEDGKMHNQPSGVGHIPVSNMACISKKLRNSGNLSLMDMASKGGVFFPLYQREAMFLSFKATNDSFAVRPFVGGVNAVSGLVWNASPSQRRSKQDYVSVPPQKYLDGIAVGQETVKQFIAMPLGSGYSVEKQITGKEDVGGMQLEIIPGNQWYIRPPGDVHISLYRQYDTPRKLQADFVVLAWMNLDVRQDSLVDTTEKVADWIEEHRPVYMRHLYESQIRDNYQQPYFTPWRPGAEVYMTAVYRLNLTISYMQGGTHHNMNVEWSPWWTPEDCIQERSHAGVNIMGRLVQPGDFVLFYQGRPLGPKSLGEQGVEDHSIIQLQLAHSPQPRPSGGSYQIGSQIQDQTQSIPPYRAAYDPQAYCGVPQYYASLPSSAASLPQQPSDAVPGESMGMVEQGLQPQRQGGHTSHQSHNNVGAPPTAAMPTYNSPSPQQQQQHTTHSPMAASPGSTSSAGPPRPYMAPPPQQGYMTYSPSVSPPMSPGVSATPASMQQQSPQMALPPLQQAYPPSSPSSMSPTLLPAPRSDSAPSSISMPASSVPSPQSRPRPTDQTGWAMGIAAGSRIRQVINKDPFIHDAWCKARAAILSIQILNSVAFESLTGMLAPHSPITPQTYKDQGLPFFASYGEGAVTDGGHNLVGVRSVGEIDATGENIQIGSSLSSSTKVACSCCRRMLCDSVLRPCNHTFCSSCISNYMTYGNSVFCRICNARASKLLGFSAPMALPGEDRADFSDATVITTEPYKGDVEFQSIYELNGTTLSTYTYEQNEKHQETHVQQTVHELAG